MPFVWDDNVMFWNLICILFSNIGQKKEMIVLCCDQSIWTKFEKMRIQLIPTKWDISKNIPTRHQHNSSYKVNFFVQLMLCAAIRLFNIIGSLTRWINSWMDDFAKSWINLKINGSREILTQKQKINVFPHPGFELQSPGTESQCANIELPWPDFPKLFL